MGTVASQGVGQPRDVLPVDAARAGAAVHLWFDAEALTMIEIVDPVELESWPHVQAQIGAPELTTGQQRAYPSRGIAFVVSEDEHTIDEVLLFVPTSNDDYEWSYALPDTTARRTSREPRP